MSESIINVSNISKRYKIYKHPRDRLKEMFFFGKRSYHHDFWALQDVSFEMKKGDTIGIIGHNGSGKSTLLQIIAGVLQPTGGIVTRNGRISSLLELGTGFNPDFTGRANVLMNGALMGFSQKEMEERMPLIEDFAEIGEFIDQPVKTYSSGMYVRLAFAAAINVDPDILIVDEALAVGDMRFQAKCITKMRSMIDKVALILVSHDLNAVKSVCEKAILLKAGKIDIIDTAEKVTERYLQYHLGKEQDSTGIQDENSSSGTDQSDFARRVAYQRVQNGRISIYDVQLLDEQEKAKTLFNFAEYAIVRIFIDVERPVPWIFHGYHIKDKNGTYVVYSDSVFDSASLRSAPAGKMAIDWKFRLSLASGNYTISVVLSTTDSPTDDEHAPGEIFICDFIPSATHFSIAPSNRGMLHGAVHWQNDIRYITL